MKSSWHGSKSTTSRKNPKSPVRETPGSSGAMPLSGGEQRTLDDIERTLRDGDPEFAANLSFDGLRRRRRLREMVAAVTFVLGWGASGPGRRRPEPLSDLPGGTAAGRHGRGRVRVHPQPGCTASIGVIRRGDMGRMASHLGKW